MGFSLKDEADLWWATIRDRQYELGLCGIDLRSYSKIIFTLYASTKP